MGAYKNVTTQTNLLSAISDSFSVFESLHESMEEWRSNMEEKLSNTSKYSEVEEAVNALENLTSEPSIPDCLQTAYETAQITVHETVPTRKRYNVSRQVQHDNAVSALTAARDQLQEDLENAREGIMPDDIVGDDAEDWAPDAEYTPGTLAGLTSDDLDDVGQLITDLSDAIDNADGVSYPGMY